MTRHQRPLAPVHSPAHLALSTGETHPGYFTECEACRLYRAEHPGARVPSRGKRAGEVRR